MEYFKSPDKFTEAALVIAELESVEDIFSYINEALIRDEENNPPSRFRQALYEIKIAVFHKMVEHEFSYNEIKSEFEYVNEKIKDTEGQEIQSKWKALREHMTTKMKAMEKEQAEKTSPQSISEYSSGYFASSRKSSIPSAGKEIISGLRRKFLFGNQ